MSLELWIAFTAASAVLLVIPGPTILLVVTYALGQGRRSAMATVAGVTLGDFTSMTASMLGLGVLLLASSTLFVVLKWVGAAYLVFLGIKLWRTPVADDPETAAQPATRSFRMFMHAYVVTALNPKTIAFFVAFLPQFMDVSRPLLTQMIILESTFLVLACLNAAGYAMAASFARSVIRKPAVQRSVNRLGGSFLIGAGALTVASTRNAS